MTITRTTSPTRSPRPARRIRRLTAAATGLALAAVLAACSSSAPAATSTASADGFGDAGIALSWIKNYEFAGYFYADQDGDYTDNGFDSVDIIAGGGTTNSWDSVLAGQATIGLASDLTGVTGAIEDGAPLKIIGAQFVKSPVGFVSLAGNPISSIDDLAGKTIGVDAGGKLAVEAVLRANDLPEDTVTFVSVPNGIDPLMNGDVDALIGFLTNYPLAVEAAGGDAVTLSFSDAGYAQMGDAVVVSTDALENDREAVKALMKSVIEGWNTALTDGPQGIADIAMEYGGSENDLDPALQLSSATVLPSFMLTDETVANGIFTISSDLADQAVSSLAAAGIDTSADSLFDLSLLQEVYDENPELIPGFEVPQQ
ncbi:ABC transporter substrate-binding protein [Herbiconiux moechotypicola]|uniref:Thiamine pyrimidine synthase n=1 Tax=Herbiconiux moechotypicola TaxID=637393 RepID=A0ABN3DHF0_9MICO|nr:ABC transporter substrate-binding protein [Herbiconiux moechotypicola]MCS5729638.1 ABC transporter substrate-binding protein [Herbiconiux moechotypicola]